MMSHEGRQKKQLSLLIWTSENLARVAEEDGVFSMRRREFIAFVGGLAAWPTLAGAETFGRSPLIGVLMAFDQNDPMVQGWMLALSDELRKLGWTKDHNVRVEYRYAGSDVQAMQRFAKELVELNPNVILSSSTPPTKVLMQHTRTIPIVFGNLVDPVGSGLVASLARPGGNVTGFVNLDPSVATKWVQLMKEVAPNVTRVAIPYNPTTAPYAPIYLTQFEAAAKSLGMESTAGPVKSLSELETFITEQVAPNVGVIPVPDGFMNSSRGTLASAALRHKLPAAHFNRAFVEVGGLFSYGNDTNDNYRRAAAYLDRILKGEKPSELPVQFPIKFEFAINRKTAKALDLEVSSRLVALADTVVE
jgi:ABC-type uncharacterized transport system substrate-binding protein